MQKTSHLATNLRHLCARYPSVADVCRRIGVNRQQFNKYLSGESEPSLRNLQRITNFFGVDEYEISLPHAEFVRTVMPRRSEADVGGLLQQLMARLFFDAAQSLEAMRPYCGTYAVYFCTPVWSSHLVRSLTVIGQDRQVTFTKNIQRLAQRNRRTKVVQKFRGTALYHLDRIYVLEYEAMSSDLVALTILYPSHRKQRTYLTGIMLTIASGGHRQPFASRVVYEYLGDDADIETELAACQVYAMDSPEIPEDIRSRIGNISDLSDTVLLAQSF